MADSFRDQEDILARCAGSLKLMNFYGGSGYLPQDEQLEELQLLQELPPPLLGI